MSVILCQTVLTDSSHLHVLLSFPFILLWAKYKKVINRIPATILDHENKLDTKSRSTE